MIKNLLLSLTFSILFANVISAQIVYKDVAPIFINRCGSCHHAGSTYPYLTYYGSVSSHIGMIQNDIITNKMPPWSPDTTYTRFTHERILPLSERNKILSWISAGAPMGDTTLAPAPPLYATTLLTGTPDLILTIPTYTSNATVSDKYVCFSLPTGLMQKRVLRAYEIIPGNPAIVHHAVINVDTMGTTTTDLSGGCYTIGGDFSLGAYAPGSAPTVFPNSAALKFGMNIKAGSKIVLQMHYPAGSAGQTDNTQIRLFFYPIGEPGIRQIFASTPLQNWTFNIPANTTKTVTAIYPSVGGVPLPLSVLSIFPHSHKVCTAITNYAQNGSTIIPLCRINKWNFEWQGFYTFPNLVKIPTGYTIKGSHYFDNTATNPFAPIATAVVAGVSTADEMVFDGLMWTYYYPGDELIDIGSILAADPLLNNPVGIKNVVESETKISVSPNPFSDKVSLFYELKTTEFVSIVFYNVSGQEVASLPARLQIPGKHTSEWDGKNNLGTQLAAGVYTYKINIGTKSHSGKIILK